MILLSFFLLAVGILVLVKSSDFVIKKSIYLATVTNISYAFIGFIILAIGTSIPELAVTVLSSFEKQTPLALGTLFGANVTDIGLVLGILCIFSVILIGKKDMKMLLLVTLITSLSTALAMVMGGLSFNLGCLLIVIFLLLSYHLVKNEHFAIIGKNMKKVATSEIAKIVFLVLLGILMVILSASVVIGSAVDIANFFGISSGIIGVLLAMGTTLPELSVSLTALKRKNVSLAMGNIIGSLFVNLTLLLGIAALIQPINLDHTLFIVTSFVLLSNIVLYLITRKKWLSRRDGIILLALYAIFLSVLFVIGIF